MILGSSELRIWPNWDELRFVLIPGVPDELPTRKLFVRLYASARNSRLCLSRTRKARASERSNCHDTGRTSVARPIFPRVPTAGSANARGFKYCDPGRPDLSRYTFSK